MSSGSAELATLRALTFRISSTPTAQLPQHVPAIASSLANCRTLLSSTQSSSSKDASSSEASVSVHKYRTLLSTLIQDRTVQGRWAAIVLIKATVEVGGWETLQKCLPWVRGLLGILTKPDPTTSKKLCIITLTRIFMLTRDFPTLIREITTPSLPTFVQTCTQIANNKAPSGLLQIILESFSELLPRHPTIFRFYLKQLHPLLSRLIAPTPSTKLASEQVPGGRMETTSGVIMAAQQLYVQLPCCAPKGASHEDWQKSLKSTISSAHRVADKVFRAVHEDWQSSTREAPSTNCQTMDDEVNDLEPSDVLPPWSGMFPGSERLVHLLQLVQQYFNNSTANPVYLDVAAVVDLASRLLSLTAPGSGSKAFQTAVKFNNQVSKDERDNLWSILPNVHVATIDVLLSLANRLQSSTLPLDTVIIDQVVWLFGSESNLVQIRAGCYAAVASILQRSGVALGKSSIDALVPLMRACCADLLPSEINTGSAKDSTQLKTNGTAKPQGTANADSFLGASKAASDGSLTLTGLKDAAYNLLPLLFANIRAQYLSDSLRARLDRTAVLTQHKDAMVNSVLNPPPSKKFGKPAASILPLMARSFAADRDIEGLLRPRMPVIRLRNQDTELAVAEEEEEEEEEKEEEEEHDEGEAKEHETEPDSDGMQVEEQLEQEQKDFIGHKLDSILQSAGGTTSATQDTPMAGVLAEGSHDHAIVDAPKPNALSTQEPDEGNIMSKDPSKRPYTDEIPLSPSKRMKGTEEEQRITHPIPPVATIPSRVTRSTATSSALPTTSDFTVTNTTSAVPDLPVPGGTGGDGIESDDDDDVIPLVMGQDTDDESE